METFCTLAGIENLTTGGALKVARAIYKAEFGEWPPVYEFRQGEIHPAAAYRYRVRKRLHAQNRRRRAMSMDRLA